jgi:hypothetical protein
VSDEWFRSPGWTTDDANEFERRLQRALAHNRPQYLRIKAISLREHGGEAERRAARELNERVIREYPEAAFDVLVAREELARLAEDGGDPAEAIRHWRAAIYGTDEGMPQGEAYLRLPELLIRSDDPANWDEAASIVGRISPERDLAFSNERFRYAVIRARLSHHAGDTANAAQFARLALTEAERTTPDFARHRDLGWVAADSETLLELERLAQH